MRRVVGVADMCVSTDVEDVIVTHALGSCLGIAVYDKSVPVAGLLHVMLPLSRIDAEKAQSAPFMFVDTAIPLLFQAMFDCGAEKRRLVVKVAGGAMRRETADGPLAIGKRNWIVLKRLLWKNGILIAAEDVGGTLPRGMRIAVDTGAVTLTTNRTEKTL